MYIHKQATSKGKRSTKLEWVNMVWYENNISKTRVCIVDGIINFKDAAA